MNATEPSDEPDCVCVPRRPKTQREHRLEFSFGSAELFMNQSVYDPAGIIRQRVIPITSVSVFGEWLFHPRFSTVVQFVLPLEPETTLVEDRIVAEYVPPTLSAGARATAFVFDILDDTALELQWLALFGSTLGDLSRDKFFPTMAWRFHLRERRGFTMYAGASFAFRENAAALIYGVGHRF